MHTFVCITFCALQTCVCLSFRVSGGERLGMVVGLVGRWMMTEQGSAV